MKSIKFIIFVSVMIAITFSLLSLIVAQDYNKNCSAYNGTLYNPYNENSRLYCNGTELFASDGNCCIGQLTINPTQPCPQKNGIYCTSVSDSNNECPSGLMEYGFYCSDANMKCCYNSTRSSEEFFNESDRWFKEEVNQIMHPLFIFIIIGAIFGFFVRTGIQALFFRIFTKKYNLSQGYWKAFLAVFFPALILNLIALSILLMRWKGGVLLFIWVLLFPLLIVSTKAVYKTETKIAAFVALKYFILITILLLVATTIMTLTGFGTTQGSDFFINLKSILVGGR